MYSICSGNIGLSGLGLNIIGSPDVRFLKYGFLAKYIFEYQLDFVLLYFRSHIKDGYFYCNFYLEFAFGKKNKNSEVDLFITK